MDYKEIVKEQIEILKAYQSKIALRPNEMCMIATTITDLAKAAHELPPSPKK